MRGADAAVAGNHNPGLLIKRFNITFDHGVADHLGFGVGGVAFANDADIHLDRRKFIGFRNFRERVAEVGAVGLEIRNGEAIRAAEIGDSSFDALGIFVLLIWNDDFDVGVPRFVGIAVS